MFRTQVQLMQEIVELYEKTDSFLTKDQARIQLNIGTQKGLGSAVDNTVEVANFEAAFTCCISCGYIIETDRKEGGVKSYIIWLNGRNYLKAIRVDEQLVLYRSEIKMLKMVIWLTVIGIVVNAIVERYSC